jgi:hypothetical protein
MVGKITTLPNVSFCFAQCQFLFYKNVSEKLEKKGERCRMKYLEGTFVARGISKYLEDTTEELEMVMCD